MVQDGTLPGTLHSNASLALSSVVAEIVTSSCREKHPPKHLTCCCLSCWKIPVLRVEPTQVQPLQQSILWRKCGIQMPGVGFDLLSIEGVRKGPSRDYLLILMKIICCLEMRMLIKRHPLLFIAGWVSGSSKERNE